MVICDRCQATAVDKLTFEQDDQRFDLCASCKEIVLETLTKKKAEEPQDMKETPTSAKRKNKDK